MHYAYEHNKCSPRGVLVYIYIYVYIGKWVFQYILSYCYDCDQRHRLHCYYYIKQDYSKQFLIKI